MPSLHFDSYRFAQDLCEELLNGANRIMERFLQDARMDLKEEDQELEPAIFDLAGQRITAQCIFYARSILESYGTGTEMDTNNEYLKKYFNSNLWNPVRRSIGIVGRPKGSYINIFGDEDESTGRSAGKAVNFYDGEPTNNSPSYAIQNAEKRLESGLRSGGEYDDILRLSAEEFIRSSDKSKYFKFS